MIDILLVIAGFVVLVFSAGKFVDGASSLALNLNIPTIVIGLTIVAFGTSAPELAVNIASSIHKTSEITLGNIIGSNIINIAVILGLTSVVRPLEIQRNTTLIEIPLVVLSSFVVFVIANDKLIDRTVSVISRGDGLVLLMFFSIFLVYNVLMALAGSADEEDYQRYSLPKSVIYIVLGLALLVFSGNLIVESTVNIAANLGISQRVISLTVVSLGTSLPEMATSIIAARRGKVDLAVGNVVGSNIFNVFLVLGISGVVYPVSVQPETFYDLLFNIGVSILLYLFVIFGRKESRRINRIEGSLFLVFYALYLAFLLYH